MSESKIAIAGYSGHGFSVAESALSQGLKLTHYTDKKIAKKNPFALNYLGFEGNSDFFSKTIDYDFILGIGDNNLRINIYNLLRSHNIFVRNVVHKSAIVSNFCSIGSGNFIAGGVIVNAGARIGNASILNSGSIIEHGCILGDAVHIAPGTTLAGEVRIGHRTLIGANAVVLPGIQIGANSIIGSGSVVTKDVPDGTMGFGNPMKIKTKS